MADPVSLAITVALNAAVMGMTMMQKIEGPRLKDLSVSTADYGTPLVNIHGASRVECPCFYVEPIREVKTTTKTKGGKYTNYKYYGTWASFLADHEINAVLKVWLDRQLTLDRTATGPLSLQSAIATALGNDDNLKLGNTNWRVYLGTETQQPDPRMLATITTNEGPGRCPAYLGVAYMMFEEIPLEKFGNRMPQVSAVAMRGTGTDPHSYYSTVGLSSLLNSGITPNRKRLIATDSFGAGNHVQVWDLISRTLVSEADTPCAVNGNDLGIASSSSFYVTTFGPSLWLLDVYGGGADLGVDFETAAVGGVQMAGGEPFILPGISTWHEYSDSSGALYPVDFAPTCFFTDINGDPWVIGPTGTGGNIGIVPARGGSGTIINTGFDGACAAMDNGNGQFFVFQQNGRAFLIDQETLTITNTSAAATGSTGGSSLRRQFNVVSPGVSVVWVGYSQFDTQTGELIRTVNPLDWKNALSTRTIFDPLNNAIIAEEPFTGTDITWRFLDRLNPDGVTLGSICTIVADLAGMQPGDYDFTQLDQIVAGYAWTQGAAKDVIGALLEIYDSDIRPHGFIQEGRKRGQPLSGPPISAEWMVRTEGEGGGDSAPLYRVPLTSETDLPRRVFCTFADSTADDQPNTAIAQRNAASVETSREASFDLTTMRSTPDAMQPMVERALRRFWVGSTKPEFAVSPLEILLEPGDVRIVSFDDVVLRCRATRTRIRANRIIDTQWEVDGESPEAAGDWQADAFSPLDQIFNSPGGFTNGRPPDVILIPLDTEGFVIDTGLLTDGDDFATPFLYVAAAPFASGFWPGAGAWSSDFGTIESYVAGWETFASNQGAVWGMIIGSLGTAETDVIDNATTLTVIMPLGDTLTSVTEDQLLADPTLNLAVVGDEIIQFRDAELIATAPKKYELTGLIRGARGTEWAVADHAGGERFLLITANVRRHVMGATEIGDTDYYKFSTLGDDLPDVPTITVPFAANANRPLSPAHVSLVRNTGTGDWTITWLRRSRIGGSTVDGQDVPLGESSELYRVKIMDGITVVRTIEVTAQTATYTAAQQTADWGSGQTSLTVEVVQVSPTLSLEGFETTASA